MWPPACLLACLACLCDTLQPTQPKTAGQPNHQCRPYSKRGKRLASYVLWPNVYLYHGASQPASQPAIQPAIQPASQPYGFNRIRYNSEYGKSNAKAKRRTNERTNEQPTDPTEYTANKSYTANGMFKRACYGCGCGLAWLGLAWPGLVWPGLAWLDSVELSGCVALGCAVCVPFVYIASRWCSSHHAKPSVVWWLCTLYKIYFLYGVERFDAMEAMDYGRPFWREMGQNYYNYLGDAEPSMQFCWEYLIKIFTENRFSIGGRVTELFEFQFCTVRFVRVMLGTSHFLQFMTTPKYKMTELLVGNGDMMHEKNVFLHKLAKQYKNK